MCERFLYLFSYGYLNGRLNVCGDLSASKRLKHNRLKCLKELENMYNIIYSLLFLHIILVGIMMKSSSKNTTMSHALTMMDSEY